MKQLFRVAFAFLLISSASATVVDGSKDVDYGDALAVQTVQTSFGDDLTEWNAAYARIDGGLLYVMLTGNLEANFNRLEVFIDSTAGGPSVFDSSGNDNAGRMDGLVFDAGFTANFHLIFRRGTDTGNDKFDLDFAHLIAQSASGYSDILSGSGLEGTGSTGTGVNFTPITVGYNNSNTDGIIGGNAAADQPAAAAVTTGLEFSIALSDLGYIGGPIHIMVGQNGSGHDFWSNQFLGGLPAPQGSLGGDEIGNFTGEGAIDMTHFAGNQFFTIPEPSTWILFGAGAAWLGLRRRRVS